MSQRGKRQPNRTEDGPIATKRRKCRPSTAEEEVLPIAVDASGSWTPRAIPSIYNRTTTEAPAELFRKDLISAMKLPDSEPLSTDEYWVITDQWKQEWERGVQVPVNPDSLPEPTVTVNHFAATEKAREFKLPKSKYIRITKDENFASESHFLSSTPAKAEKACAYDLDDCDAAWLNILNGERACMGLPVVTDDQLERVIEELEVRCWEKVQTIVKAEEGLGIEYDENVICDVCRSPDSEEGNEMVFCDCCNICVHQACYGITTIPSGSWLCRTCALGQRPECVLCPNKGGAMKCTRSGQKWAHVSCALWIPEVSIGCVERMEPITKISSIPQSRWALICVLCRERVGACIQCSVKTCKTAYHVTCAFKHGLEMRAIIEDENADDGVKLRSYCQKHSVTSKKEKCGSQSEEEESKRRKRKDMTSEEKNQARAAKLHEVQAEFEKHVSVKDITQTMDVDPEGVTYIYNYWKLKRRAGFNRPLLPPKSEDVDMLSHQQGKADLEKMKMFVQLRQDLERVRNLCYMVSRREKLSRTFFRMREQTFHKQAAVLSDSASLKGKEIAAVIEANHGPSIYDRLYSQPSAENHSINFDLVVARIAGTTSPLPNDDKAKVDLNGLVKCATDRKGDNPYKRLYFNGATRRRSSLYGSMSSESESDALHHSPAGKIRGPLYTESSSQDEEAADKARGKSAAGGGKVKAVLRKKSRKSAASRTKAAADGGGTTSDDDGRATKGSWPSRSRSLRQMEREMASATDDSDELLPMKTAKAEPQKIAAIYSDSDSDGSHEDKYPSGLRTKAAMKEFSGLQAKSQAKVSAKSTKAGKKAKEKRDDSMDDESTKDKENVKSSKVPSDLIVPQRQAAKKASESMRFSHGRAKDATLVDQDAKVESPAEEPRQKVRHKSAKDDEPLSNEDTQVTKKSRHKSAKDVFDFDREPLSTEEALAYVPQRQAAKKAADSIKSGMNVVKAPTEEAVKDEPLKAKDKVIKKEDVAEKKLPKSPSGKTKPPPKSRAAVSSSSSSSSSGDSSSSSDSDVKPPVKADKREPQKESAIKKRPQSAVGSKPREAWPFLDKGDQSSRSSSSSSAGSDSSDSDMFTRKKETKNRPRPAAIEGERSATDKGTGGKFRKAPDKKLKTSERRPEPEFEPPIADGSRVGGGRSGAGRKGDGDRFRNASRRPRAVSVPKSDDDDEDSGTDRDRSRSARVAQSPRRRPSGSEGHGHKEGGASGPREQDTPQKADKKVSLDFCAKGRAAREAVSSPIEAAVTKLQRKIMREKMGSLSPPKRTPKPSSTKLYDRRATKNDKPPLRKGGAWHKTIMAKGPEPRRKTTVSPPRDSRKSSRMHDLFDGDQRKEKSSPSKHETVIKSTKQNSVTPPTSNSHRSKESKDSNDASRSRRRPKETTPPPRPPSKDRRVIPVAQVLAVKRDDSPDSVVLDQPDGTLKKKPKAMPKCKKKELEMLTTEKDDVVVIESPMRNSQNSPKRTDCFPKPEEHTPPKPEAVIQPTEPYLPKLDLDHDFLVPEHESEPRKITSRTSSLSGPPYQQRSIFSPQQPKDSAAADLFDFENDILAVDETVNDDGFNMPGDGEELCRPLTFSFGSDFLFKEETKEDSERATLNLVEKLRLQYAQKTTGPTDAAETPPPMPVEEDDKSVNVHEEVQAQPEIIEVNEPEPIVVGHPHFDNKYAHHEEIAKLAYPRDNYVPMDARAASIPSVEKLDRTNSAPSDERWVPPSADLAPPIAFEPPPPPYEVPPPQYEAPPSVAPPPSPFTDHRARAKWADSEVLPVRRSSSSSGSSSSSSSHREEPEPLKRDEFPFPHNPADLYQMHGGYPADPYHPYAGPVALFPPATAQLPFPSPGAGMYPPLFGPSYMPVAPPPSKEEPPPPLSAAFTSSSHNMAFIAAMVATPNEPANQVPGMGGPNSQLSPMSGMANQMSPMGAPSNQAYPMAAMSNQISPMGSMANQMSPMGAPNNQGYPMSSMTNQVSPMGVPSNQESPISNHVAGKESPSGKKTSDVGKKSPTKGTRTSARVTSQLKSPGKSPRQEAAKSPRVARSPRPRGKSRGAGARRGRGRGKAAMLSQDMDRGTIHSKLAGTVYDLEFDDDAGVESMRAMRDRRRSADAPRFASPAQVVPSPVEHEPEPEIGAVLPGPVDMRTYSGYGEPTPANPAAYHNHVLGQFATAVAQQHVADFVEDLEKELHTALAARSEPPPVAVEEFKVSLNDSRNQLKVKIKGPFLDANYATSTVATAPAPPPADAVVTPTATAFTASGVSSLRRMRKKELLRQYCSQDMNMVDPSVPPVPAPNPPISRTIITIPKAVASMTTIPTREDYKAVVDANMEKKRRKEKSPASAPRELRHLDMADVAGNCLPERRRSMGSTGSNASSAADAGAKKRGRPGAKPGNAVAECPVLKIKLNSMGRTEAQAAEDRKRLKPPKKRLSNVAMPSMEDMKRESMKFRRLVMAEFDLKKEEKKLRREARAASGKPPKKRKHKDKDSKGLEHEVRIVANSNSEETTSAPKLIIRFNKRSSVNDTVAPATPAEEAEPASRTTAETKEKDVEAKPAPTESEKKPTAEVPPNGSKTTGPSPLLKVRASKVTPIRLKLARCSEGYVMKSQPATDALVTGDKATATVTITDAEQVHSKNGSPVMVNKGCEVR